MPTLPKRDSLTDRLLFRPALAAWSRAGDAADHLDAPDLAALRGRAWRLRHRLDRVIHTADARLAALHARAGAPRLPLGSDWGFRPAPFSGPIDPRGLTGIGSGTRLGPRLTLFHDAARAEIALRQIANTGPKDSAPYGLSLEVFGFDGGFLSMVFDLPSRAVEGLRRRHLIRLEAALEVEAPVDIFARLNIRHGPNLTQVVRALPPGDPRIALDFDLAASDLNDRRAERMWMDLILDGPGMNRILLSDLVLSRRPRAEA
ncbi:hypothetical protein DSD19_14475 [Rhodovulum sp. BSW8]|uniref:Uncharacterized protein n=1 Tax=Rhodovulum visakhapatnamense TaxID=364297 RepID=A0A4R8G267_9RHOB|nr:hypothetical protein BV509_02775 [Rhodovulum sulfidophilum]RBO52313.1 hypothetical protein DSD19_14475 [Rhodovulum sp. BSW8]TDX33358.1 hypothetical protein EV657_102235 [Rhodovulum visakhapatnamense]